MPVVTVNTSVIDENLSKLSSPFDYFRLMKPRVMSLVVFTAFVGYFTAEPVESYNSHPFLALIGYLRLHLELELLGYLISGTIVILIS